MVKNKMKKLSILNNLIAIVSILLVGCLIINHSLNKTYIEKINATKTYLDSASVNDLEIDRYKINDSKKIIYGIDNNLLVGSILNMINSNGSIKVTNTSGTSAVLSDKLATGYKLTSTLDETDDEYKLSVLGDVEGIGEVSIDGAKETAKHIVDGNILTGDEYLMAADIDGDGNIKMNDVMRMAKTIEENNSTEATTISYDKSTIGKFFYVNNPEKLNSTSYLADDDNGKRLTYHDTFSGNMELYYEHSVGIEGGVYYAIRFYNSNDYDVTLKINNTGISYGWSFISTWDDYFSGKNITPQDTYTIGSKKVLCFFYAKDKYVNDFSKATIIPKGQAFDGVLNVTSSGTLTFATLAFNGNYNNTDNAKYIGNSEAKDDILAYSGGANHSPNLYSNVLFTIDDSISAKSNLKVTYNEKTYEKWITNDVGAYTKDGQIKEYTDTYNNDIVNIAINSESGQNVTIGAYPAIDTRSKIEELFGLSSQFNAANWAIHYNENITLKNIGSKTRTVSFIVNNDWTGKTIMAFPNNEKINYLEKNTSCIRYNDTYQNVVIWKVKIEPGQTLTIPTTVILGGNSTGRVVKKLYVDE